MAGAGLAITPGLARARGQVSSSLAISSLRPRVAGPAAGSMQQRGTLSRREVGKHAGWLPRPAASVAQTLVLTPAGLLDVRWQAAHRSAMPCGPCATEHARMNTAPGQARQVCRRRHVQTW